MITAMVVVLRQVRSVPNCTNFFFTQAFLLAESISDNSWVGLEFEGVSPKYLSVVISVRTHAHTVT